MSGTAAEPCDLLVRDVRVAGLAGATCVAVRGERIAHVGADAPLPARETVDGGGALVLPGLVEPHAHLDKNYSHDCRPVAGSSGRGALCDAIAAMRDYKQRRTPDDTLARAERGLRRAVTAGVCYLRSHVDMGGPAELDTLDGLLQLARDWADRVTLEFTVLGDLSSAAGRELCAQALRRGAVALGGTPALCPDPRAAVDAALQLAADFGVALDLHIDETEDPASPCLEYLARRCLDLGWSPPVAASHCCSLGFLPAPERERIVALVARAGISVITLPACNLILMGRDMLPVPRGVPPARELLAAGVNLAVGTDNVQDPFQPWGDYDPLASANLLAHLGQFGAGEEATLLELATVAPARALGLEPRALEPGARADFALLDCADLHTALAERPLRRRVFFAGRQVLEQSLATRWSPT